jgi:predicted RNA-binding Zn ribbon-like protein
MKEWRKTEEVEAVAAQSPMAGMIAQPAGHPCLDFANTVEPRLGPHPRDGLTSYEDLIAWGETTGLLAVEQAEALREVAAQEPAAARAALEQAKELREAIYRAFSALAARRAPAEADLCAIRDAYAEAAHHGRCVPGDDMCRWEWPVDIPSLDELFWPIAYSTVALLTSPLLGRVKECPGSNDCGWLFLDETKNGSRRWCSMESCGSRVKMRRHYARKRAEKG